MSDTFTENLLACPNVKRYEKSLMQTIEGDASGVTGITAKLKGESVHLPLTGVFIYAAGSKPITDFLGSSSAVKLNEAGGVEVDDEMMTSEEGVWAIGDIR